MSGTFNHRTLPSNKKETIETHNKLQRIMLIENSRSQKLHTIQFLLYKLLEITRLQKWTTD